jgi:hypothetical protein
MVPSRAQTHRSALENYAATYSRWVERPLTDRQNSINGHTPDHTFPIGFT